MLMGIAPLVGAILATVGLIFAGGALKATSFFFNLLVPLPIAALTLREGVKTGFIAFAITTSLFAIINPDGGVFVYLIQFGIASYLLPTLLRQGMAWDKAIVVSCGAMIITIAVAMTVLATAQGISLGGMVNDYMTKEIVQIKEIYNQSKDLPVEQRDQLFTVLDQVGSTMAIIWPSVIAILAGFLLLIQVFFLGLIPATKNRLTGTAFIDWKVPDFLVWPMITAGFCVFFTTATVQAIAINLLIIIFPLYYLQGLAIVTFYFQQRGTSPWLRALSYLLCALFNPLPFIIAGVGLFDLWGNFRKERVKQNSD